MSRKMLQTRIFAWYHVRHVVGISCTVSVKGDRFVAEPPLERTSLRMVNIEKYFGSVCALKNINFEVGQERNRRSHRGQRRRQIDPREDPHRGVPAHQRRAVHRGPEGGHGFLLGEEGARAGNRDRVPGQVPRGEAGHVAELLHRPGDHLPARLPEGARKKRRSPTRSWSTPSGSAARESAWTRRRTSSPAASARAWPSGRAMHFEADLIILDEPTVALSLKEVRKVLNFVHKIKEAGKASIYISHNLADVYEISDRFIVIDRGEIVASIVEGEDLPEGAGRVPPRVLPRPERQGAAMNKSSVPPCVPRQDGGPAHRHRARRPVRGVHLHRADGVHRVPDLHVLLPDGAPHAGAGHRPHLHHHRGRDRPELPGGCGAFGFRLHLVVQELP